MIGFIGGTGNQGQALAFRIASTGEKVMLGSRSIEKAKSAVDKIKETKKSLKLDITPAHNEIAAECDIVFITLPYSTLKSTLDPLKDALKGKIIVDVINPLTNNNIHKGISASEELQQFLKSSRVVCAFKNVSSYLLWNFDNALDTHSIVCSDFQESKKTVIDLSERMGIPSIDGGPLENALASELLTRMLLYLNKEQNAETGIRFVSFKH